ncbi:MAG TPA: TIGR02301 family protein [Sinorhizobium sp.]|nr:TIGR02301 family protein [Sinorhizobium sp.]
MTFAPLIFRLLLTGTTLAMPAIAAGQETPPPSEATAPAVEAKPPPYEQRLIRLAEILGSVHYLRNLCSSQPDDGWRRSMQDLIDKETADEPQRRERMTAAFNRGYRTFASVYTACTEPATVAEERYRAEGATLASEIVARFGN